MKKLLTVILSVAAVCCAAVGVACSSHTHTWVATDDVDENGNTVYVCDCGEVHEHTFATEWSTDENGHWYASTCGHGDAVLSYAEHTYGDDGVCTVCGYEQGHVHTYSTEWTYDETYHWHEATCGDTDEVSGKEAHTYSGNVCTKCGYEKPADTEYEILFAYYTDDNGDGSYDSNGAYDDDGNTVYDTYRGVTYTAVEYKGLTVDIDGDYLVAGDTFAFTVKKSVFCVFDDSRDYALVEVVYMDEDGELDSYTVNPDGDGIYYVTVESDTVITVTNVVDMDMTIDGSGTESDPYTINSVIDWLYFASLVNDKDWYTSLTYNIAYWKLTCDLDFEGESVYIVGDGYSSSYSMFMGCFDGDNHTLSNFVIDNSVYGSTGEYSTYVGVFGILSGYAGVDTSIKNLKVKNYTIDAGASADSAVCAGGLVGYIAGASVINCTVSGCTINITADADYASYAGGVAGMIQSGYSESEGIIFYASVQYCAVDADISGTGYIYETGGVAGRSVPYGSISPVFIFNCYTSGIYTDSAQTGGIVGYAGRYTSVQNCYSTADITTSATQTNVSSGYEDTAYDYRYSYAGGIAGYAENDTVIACCFFAGGTLNASAVAGSSYAATDNIIAGYSEAGFEDYRAAAVLLLNNLDGSSAVTDDALKALGWNTADWIFGGDGRPTINTETASYKYTIKVVIGTTTTEYAVDSIYIPMSYWYVQARTDSTALPEYLTGDGTNRTYGYYFDEDLTRRVPVCYVPMGDITLYAGYADYSDVAGVYVINSNDIEATLTLESDGTYELSYGAIYLSGDYEYNGTYVTMADSYFSRFITAATETQQETYFTFWAEVNADGDLEIYDCEVLFEIDETYDSYGYTFLARLVTKDSPLVAVSKSRTEICGSYYAIDTYDSTNKENTFTFDVGYTGTAYFNGGYRTITYYYESGTLYVVMNGVTYTATITDGKITSLENLSGATVYTLIAYDDFEGTWEQSATIDKKYTFDGKGTWVYYVDGVKVTSGEYVINGNGELTFTRSTDNMAVTVTLNADGTLNVKEETGSTGVTYYGEGGYQGIWYTAAISGNRYTLELGGIDGSGAGILDLSGAGVSLTDMPYISVDGVLYTYSGDTLYGMLVYDETDFTLTGYFYNSSTESLSTTYLFYLYDNFRGDWFSDISGLEKLTFNGFGAYDVSASVIDGVSTLAVNGTVTINGADTAKYYLNASGEYEFIYNGVTYTIKYDENNNEVTVNYVDGEKTVTDKLIAGDDLYGVTYVVNGETYVFDGAGNLSVGGTVTIDGAKSASYVIDSSTGVITVTYEGATYAVFTPVTDGGDITSYSVAIGSGTYTATVENDFTGTWVIVGAYASITVPEITYYVSGTVIEFKVTYASESYSGEIDACYDGTAMWIYLDSSGTTIYYINNVYGSMFMSTTYSALDEDEDNLLSLCEPDGWLRYFENSDGDTVLLGGDSLYSEYNGYGDARITIDGEETDCLYKADADGNITIYQDVEDESGNVEMVEIYTFNVSANGEYSYNGEYRALVAVTTAD